MIDAEAALKAVVELESKLHRATEVAANRGKDLAHVLTKLSEAREQAAALEERLRRSEVANSALREALAALEDAATDSLNIFEHDGWHKHDPRWEWPKGLQEKVAAALSSDAGKALLAELEALREFYEAMTAPVALDFSKNRAWWERVESAGARIAALQKGTP